MCRRGKGEKETGARDWSGEKGKRGRAMCRRGKGGRGRGEGLKWIEGGMG